MSRADGDALTALEARYRALAAELATIGFVARGSVFQATTTCSSKGCHCRTDQARRHGPYWQWTRSSGGASRTRRLSQTEAELYREWIANRHRAEAILAELEHLSAEAAELILAADTVAPARHRGQAEPA